MDGWIGLAAAGASFLPVVLLLAERMRNAGKFTMADVLAFRLRERPAKIVAALGTLVVSFVYLIAQMVGAGVLLQALAGIDFTLSVLHHRARSCSSTCSSAACSPPRGCRSSRRAC